MKSLLEIYGIDEDDSVDKFNSQLKRGYTSVAGSPRDKALHALTRPYGVDLKPRPLDPESKEAQRDFEQSKSIFDEDTPVDDFNKQLSKGYTSLTGNGGSSEKPRVGTDGASQRAQFDLDQSKSVFDESKMRAKRSLIELFASLSEEDDRPKSKTAHDIGDVDFDFGDDEEDKKDEPSTADSDVTSWLDADDDDLAGFSDNAPKKSQRDDNDSEDEDEEDDEDELGPDADYDDPTPEDGDGDDVGDEDDDEPEEKNTFASKPAPPSKALQGGKGGLSIKADKATMNALSKAFSLIDTNDDDMNDWVDDCLREISKSISSGSDTLTLPKFEATPSLSDFDEYSGNSKDED